LKTSDIAIPVVLGFSDISIEVASDCSVIIYVDADKAGVAEANELIRQLTSTLVEKPPVWLHEYIPSYNSLFIEFDLDSIDHMAVKNFCDTLVDNTLVDRANHISNRLFDSNHDAKGNNAFLTTKIHRIPVCYGLNSEYSDLRKVAQVKGVSEAAIIALHCSRVYQVYATGFLPGFAYLGELPLALSQPRLDKPRLKVPAGAVAIADQQTAVYPVESPGGWHILGFTPILLLSDDVGIAPLLRAGDLVQFYPITKEDYVEWAAPHCTKISLQRMDSDK
jgi:KipI family sensor histidine kinase inhibitor